MSHSPVNFLVAIGNGARGGIEMASKCLILLTLPRPKRTELPTQIPTADGSGVVRFWGGANRRGDMWPSRHGCQSTNLA